MAQIIGQAMSASLESESDSFHTHDSDAYDDFDIIAACFPGLQSNSEDMHDNNQHLPPSSPVPGLDDDDNDQQPQPSQSSGSPVPDSEDNNNNQQLPQPSPVPYLEDLEDLLSMEIDGDDAEATLTVDNKQGVTIKVKGSDNDDYHFFLHSQLITARPCAFLLQPHHKSMQNPNTRILTALKIVKQRIESSRPAKKTAQIERKRMHPEDTEDTSRYKQQQT